MTTKIEDVELPDGLSWSDELSNSQVAQSRKRALDGSMVVFYAQLSGGRPITLESTADMGWVQKSTALLLQQMADTAGGVFTLVLRDVTYSVMFRHEDGDALVAEPVIPGGPQQDGDYFKIKMKLMTV